MGVFYSENWLEDAGKLAAAIASGMAAMFGFLKWYMPTRRRNKEIRKAYTGLLSLHGSLESIEHTVHRTKVADRAIIISAHNHGGLPAVGRPFFASAVYWAARTDAMSRQIGMYKDLPVDAAYCEMIIEVFTKGFVLLDSDTMKAGLLKEIYESEKISQALIVKLGVCDNSLIYVSYAKLNGGFRTEEILNLKLAAAAIARNML